MKTLHFDSISSTNTYLKEHYSKLEHMTFVSADEQTMGHGRNNRKWKSESGSNLLFSLLLTLENTMKHYAGLSVISALSICEVLEEYGIQPMIKWPNDVFVDDKKICGILLESVIKQKMECLIAGIGLNVNQLVFDEDNIHTPTSLALLLQKKIPLEEIREKVYSKLIKNIELLTEGHDFFKAIEMRDYLSNKDVFAEIQGHKEKIHVFGIDRDYRLKISCNGAISSLESGEVTFHV